MVLLLAFFLALTLFMLWPVPSQGNNHAVGDPYDPSFHAYTIAWDAHMLVTNPLNLFNANIFFPNRYTFAYSEHEITNGVMAVPLMAATSNPIQSANLLLIFNFFLAAVGAYLLCHHLTRNRMASVVGGMAYAFAPYMFSHVTQLSICSNGWIPLTFLFLHRYMEERRPRYAFLFALFFTLQFLANTYLGLFLFVGILVFLLVRVVTKWRRTVDLKWVVWLALAAFCALLVIFPFARIYLKVHALNPGMQRNIGEVDGYSADVQDFLVAPDFNFLWGKVTRPMRQNTFARNGPNHRSLFPGLLPLVLGILGMVYLWKRGKGESRFRFWAYGFLVVLGAVASLGTSLYLFGHRFNLPMPYDVIYRVIPGFKALRVPTIFTVLTTLALAVLASFGAKWIFEGVKRRKGPKLASLVFVIVIVLLVVDLATVALPMVPIKTPPQFAKVYYWLKDQPGKAPSVEFPMPATTQQWLDLESQRTYYSTLHWKYIVNGFSSFSPTSYAEAGDNWITFPSPKSMHFFKGLGVHYFIVHSSEMDAAKFNAIRDYTKVDPHFKLVRSFGTDYVYSID